MQYKFLNFVKSRILNYTNYEDFKGTNTILNYKASWIIINFEIAVSHSKCPSIKTIKNWKIKVFFLDIFLISYKNDIQFIITENNENLCTINLEFKI